MKKEQTTKIEIRTLHFKIVPFDECHDKLLSFVFVNFFFKFYQNLLLHEMHPY